MLEDLQALCRILSHPLRNYGLPVASDAFPSLRESSFMHLHPFGGSLGELGGPLARMYAAPYDAGAPKQRSSLESRCTPRRAAALTAAPPWRVVVRAFTFFGFSPLGHVIGPHGVSPRARAP